MSYPIALWSPTEIYAFYATVLVVVVGSLDLLNWRFEGRARAFCRVTGCVLMLALCVAHFDSDLGTERLDSRWFRKRAKKNFMNSAEAHLAEAQGHEVHVREWGPDGDRGKIYYTYDEHMRLELVFGVAIAVIAFKYRPPGGTR